VSRYRQFKLILSHNLLLGISTRAKKTFFRLIRYIPSIRNKIENELSSIQKTFEDDMSKYGDELGYIVKLPEDGWHRKDILMKMDEYLKLGHYKWQDGFVSGAVYNFDSKINDLMTKVYSKTAYTNPLHADVFPGVCKMEAEVIRMIAHLFNGGPSTCGCITTGGTESILMAVKAYRDYGREVNGIDRPNIVMPTTAHTAFDKAAKYLGITVKTVKIDPVTYKVDLKAMERAINKNTIMVSTANGEKQSRIHFHIYPTISWLDRLQTIPTAPWMTSRESQSWHESTRFHFTSTPVSVASW
jgi:sphinganine-1-phosphate aldolase